MHDQKYHIQKASFLLCVFLFPCIVNHTFIELIFIVLGQAFSGNIHSFIQAAFFSMQAESSLEDAMEWLVGVRVLATMGQAGFLAICSDSGNGQQEQASLIRSCLTN